MAKLSTSKGKMYTKLKKATGYWKFARKTAAYSCSLPAARRQVKMFCIGSEQQTASLNQADTSL